MRRLVAQLALGLALAGCTLGPNYHRPTVSAPEVWRAAQAAPDPASLADLAWWELFQDDELRRLVQTATEANKDLRIAVTRVDQARAQLGVTRSAQFPEINAGASVTTNRFSDNVPPRGQGGQAEPELASTAAQIPDLERQIAQTEHRLSILLGRNPGGISRGRPLTGQTFPPTVPAGLPSTLLERRPDIRQAEDGLVAANARIGVARTAFFPQVSLTGSFGVESVALSDLFTGPSRIWQFGPTVTLPIFNAARNRANLELVEARQREAVIRYEQAIQQAFREVGESLIAHRRAREALLEQEAAVRASREALSIVEFRYTSGLTSYLNVLDAQRTLLAAEIAERRTLLSQLVAVVQLCRALGGGWDAGLVTGKAPGG